MTKIGSVYNVFNYEGPPSTAKNQSTQDLNKSSIGPALKDPTSLINATLPKNEDSQIKEGIKKLLLDIKQKLKEAQDSSGYPYINNFAPLYSTYLKAKNMSDNPSYEEVNNENLQNAMDGFKAAFYLYEKQNNGFKSFFSKILSKVLDFIWPERVEKRFDAFLVKLEDAQKTFDSLPSNKARDSKNIVNIIAKNHEIEEQKKAIEEQKGKLQKNLEDEEKELTKIKDEKAMIFRQHKDAALWAINPKNYYSEKFGPLDLDKAINERIIQQGKIKYDNELKNNKKEKVALKELEDVLELSKIELNKTTEKLKAAEGRKLALEQSISEVANDKNIFNFPLLNKNKGEKEKKLSELKQNLSVQDGEIKTFVHEIEEQSERIQFLENNIEAKRVAIEQNLKVLEEARQKLTYGPLERDREGGYIIRQAFPGETFYNVKEIEEELLQKVKNTQGREANELSKSLTEKEKELSNQQQKIQGIKKEIKDLDSQLEKTV